LGKQNYGPTDLGNNRTLLDIDGACQLLAESAKP
jgi:hypothetical protein